MIIHDFLQGSKEWREHRHTHLNASDAPVMLGISPYRSRSQLLHEMHTGITPDIDAATQRRFSEGHRIEALARAHMEALLGGAELYPVTGTEGRLSASFDGLTEDGLLCYEHKMLNDSLRGIVKPENLPDHYRAQMEQQLMVSGADVCIFHASSWDGEVLVEEVVLQYRSDQDMRDRICASWEQFEKDLATYIPPEVVDQPTAATIMQLPSVIINATGALTASNLEEMKPRWDVSIAESKTRLATIDIANGKAVGKFGRATAVTLKLKAKEVVDQIAAVSDAVRTLEFYAAEFDAMGLAYEKAVTRMEKEEAESALNKVRAEYADHVAALQAEVEPIRLPIPQPDFAGALKNLRTVESKNNALSTALANAKITADAIAKETRMRLAWFRDAAKGYEFLFPDLQTIIQKPLEDFKLIVQTRIINHKQAEAAKLEAAILAASQRQYEKTLLGEPDVIQPETSSTVEPGAVNTREVAEPFIVPTRHQLIEDISELYGASYDDACKWLEDAFAGVAA